MKAEEYIQRITSNVNKDRVQKAILILEEHANQRVIEELERLKSDCDAEDDAYSFAMSKAHQKRIKELQQD